MRTLFDRNNGTLRASLLTVCAGFLLAGCQIDDAVLDDNYKPATHSERYPIRVEKVPVKMGIAAPTGTLKADQVNGVIMFANDAKTAGLSHINVKWPSGSARSRAAAEEMITILIDQGIPEDMIKVGSYPGSASQPIQMSFLRKVAVTEECGDWSTNLAHNPSNRDAPNFGCSMQHNIAAMVANPEDFERPRSMQPVMAQNRTAVMKVYLDNATAGDYYTLDGVAGK